MFTIHLFHYAVFQGQLAMLSFKEVIDICGVPRYIFTLFELSTLSMSPKKYSLARWQFHNGPVPAKSPEVY